jgi:hypothetical protein
MLLYSPVDFVLCRVYIKVFFSVKRKKCGPHNEDYEFQVDGEEG